MYSIALQHFAVLIGWIVVCFIIGHLFVKAVPLFKSELFFTSLFVKLLLGSVLAVTVVSIVVAKGNSIQMLSLVLLLFLIYKAKFSFDGGFASPTAKAERSYHILSLALTIVLPFLFFVVVFLQHGNFPYRAVHDDLLHYATVSNSLLQTGLENRWLSVLHLPPQVIHAEPYHYFELWLNGLLSKATELPAISTFTLVCLPFFFTLSILGLLALIEFSHPTLWWYLFAPFVFIGSTSVWSFINHNPASIFLAESPLEPFAEKTIVMYPFLFFALLFYQRHYYREALIALCFLIVIQPLAFPIVVLLAVATSVLIKRWNNLIPIGMFVFFYFIFYWLNQHSAHISITAHLQNKLPHLNWKGEFVEALLLVKPLALELARSSMCLIVVLVLYYVLDKKNAIHAIGLTGVLFFYCLFIVPLFRHLPDFQQFFTSGIAFCRVISLFVGIRILELIRNRRSLQNMCLLVISILGIYQISWSFKQQRNIQEEARVDPHFLEAFEQIQKKIHANDGIGLYGNLPFAHDFLNTKGTGAAWPLAFLPAKFYPIRLDTTQWEVEDAQSLQANINAYLRSQTPIRRLAALDSNKTPEQLLIATIQQHRIKAVISDQSAFNNPSLISWFDTVIIGPKSGSYLLVLKP